VAQSGPGGGAGVMAVQGGWACPRARSPSRWRSGGWGRTWAAPTSDKPLPACCAPPPGRAAVPSSCSPACCEHRRRLWPTSPSPGADQHARHRNTTKEGDGTMRIGLIGIFVTIRTTPSGSPPRCWAPGQDQRPYGRRRALAERGRPEQPSHGRHRPGTAGASPHQLGKQREGGRADQEPVVHRAGLGQPERREQRRRVVPATRGPPRCTARSPRWQRPQRTRR
jgi:hypothetical protein